MACEFGERRLAGYERQRQSDVPSAQAERAAIEAHVESCAACRAMLAEQQEVAAVLTSRARVEPSAHFTAAVMARLDDVAGFFGLLDWRIWTFRLAPVAVAIAIVAVFLSVPAATSSSSPLTIDEWAQAETAVDGAVPAWQSNGSADALLETMLTGASATPQTERTDGR